MTEDYYPIITSWTRYLLLKSSESLLTIILTAKIIAIISKLFHKSILNFMLINDNEAASSAGSLPGWLFIIICCQNNLWGMPEEDRYSRLIRNLLLIVIVNLHSLFKPVTGKLDRLPHLSRMKTWVLILDHARVLLVSSITIILPIWFLIHLWFNMSINSWALTVSVFGIEMILRMSISLVIYAISMINSFCDVTWRGIEDHIYYLRVSGSLISYICGILLFFNGTWVLIFENSTAFRALSLIVHAYFNIWVQTISGISAINKRRQAESKIKFLEDATGTELELANDLCPICFEKLDANEGNTKITICNHYYHTGCLTRWAYLHDTCPLCFRKF